LNFFKIFFDRPTFDSFYFFKPKILFAGEATSENCYSTVHGAFITGEKEAELLIEKFKIAEK
jgi:hypothetical protein